MDHEPLSEVKVSDTTPRGVLRRAAANPNVILNVTELSHLYDLPSRVYCQLYSTKTSFDSEHITHAYGGINLPHALNVNLPELLYTKMLLAYSARTINKPKTLQRTLKAFNNTPLGVLRRAAADPNVILDISQLNYLEHLPPRLKCQLYFNREEFEPDPKKRVLDTAHITHIEGGLEAPRTTTIHLPKVVYTKFLITPDAITTTTPVLRIIQEDFKAPELTSLSAPRLEHVRDMNLTKSKLVDTPVLKSSGNTEAPNATLFNAPQLRETGNAYIDNATIVNLDSLIISADVSANSALNLVAPNWCIAAFVNLASADRVNLENMTRLVYLQADVCTKLKIDKLPYNEFMRAVYAPQANKRAPIAPLRPTTMPALTMAADERLIIS